MKNGIVMAKLILDRFLQTLNDCKSCIIFLYLYWVFILTLPQNEVQEQYFTVLLLLLLSAWLAYVLHLHFSI